MLGEELSRFGHKMLNIFVIVSCIVGKTKHVHPNGWMKPKECELSN
jgi:hypothetical protein